MPTHPNVVLVGRVNVGKSRLFNRLSETAKALVSPIPGTTRDAHAAQITWQDHSFSLVDTGGLDAAQLGEIERYVQEKAFSAIKGAAVVLLVIDGQRELTTIDRDIVKRIRRSGVPTVLVVNKVDGPRIRKNLPPEHLQLGFNEPLLVSALTGAGTGDLLDTIIEKLPQHERQERTPDVRISIVGKTNVGKSSILNAILGEERVIVTPLPHTTREPNDTLLEYGGSTVMLVDTAGLRKKRTSASYLEKLSAQKTLQSITRSDVTIIVTDASDHLSSQDQTVAELAREKNTGVIIVGNKWDKVPDKDPETIDRYERVYRQYFSRLPWAPILFISATENQRVDKLLPLALAIQRNRAQTVPAAALNELIRTNTMKRAKPSRGKKAGVIKNFAQTGINPPSFALTANRADRVHQAFANLLEKKLRQTYDFSGTPIRISIGQ